MAMVTVPMVPCPHIGKQPLVSIYRTPVSLLGSIGGYRMLPLIISWPRGSNINPFLIQSYSSIKWSLRSIMEFPLKYGPPPATKRTGHPQVWESIQKNVFFIYLLVWINGILSTGSVYQSTDRKGIAVFQFSWQKLIWPILKCQGTQKPLDGIRSNGCKPRIGT